MTFDYYDLIIAPAVVNISYWKQGYFLAFGKKSVPQVSELSYGFWKASFGTFLNVYGERMLEQPRIIRTRGIMTMIGIAIEIKEALIINGTI